MTILLLVSSSEVRFVFPRPGGGAEEVHLPFAVWAQSGLDGMTAFSAKLNRGDEECAELFDRLGAHLTAWVDRDLLDYILEGFFRSAVEMLPADSVTQVTQLHAPLWMGVGDRARLLRAAQRAGLHVKDGLERGLIPVVTSAAAGPPPEAGGWVMVDRCPPDLDIYAVEDCIESGVRKLQVVAYRRFPGLSESLSEPSLEDRRLLRQVIGQMPANWSPLATDPEVVKLLRLALGGDVEPQTVPFARYSSLLARATAPGAWEHVEISRQWRHWLDHGDERLQPFTTGKKAYPHRAQLLLVLPDNPPDHIELALRVGFTPTRGETREVCRVHLTKPDYHAAGGHLLVTADLLSPERGTFAVEVIQFGERSFYTVDSFPELSTETVV